METRQCLYCQATIDESDNFCRKCGKPLQEMKCEKCGGTVFYGDNFCKKCGRKIELEDYVQNIADLFGQLNDDTLSKLDDYLKN